MVSRLNLGSPNSFQAVQGNITDVRLKEGTGRIACIGRRCPALVPPRQGINPVYTKGGSGGGTITQEICPRIGAAAWIEWLKKKYESKLIPLPRVHYTSF